MGIIKPSSGGSGTAPVSTATITDSTNKRFVTESEKKTINSLTGAGYIVGAGGLQAFKIIYLSALNTVMVASSNNQTHYGKIVGFTDKSYVVGDTVFPVTQGEITSPTWNLNAGDNYYLGLGGEITNIPPTSGFIQKVGIAKNATTLMVKFDSSIKLI